MEKEFRMLQDHEMRRYLRNFNGDLYYDHQKDNHHLIFSAKGRDLAIVFTVEHEGLPKGYSTRPEDEPGVAQIITQMHQKTDYPSTERFERVVR